MSERIVINGRNIKMTRQYGLLYFVSADGNVYSSPMQHKGRTKGKKQKHTLVLRTGLVRDNQRYVYFIDSEGYLSRSKRGRK